MWRECERDEIAGFVDPMFGVRESTVESRDAVRAAIDDLMARDEIAGLADSRMPGIRESLATMSRAQNMACATLEDRIASLAPAPWTCRHCGREGKGIVICLRCTMPRVSGAIVHTDCIVCGREIPTILRRPCGHFRPCGRCMTEMPACPLCPVS